MKLLNTRKAAGATLAEDQAPVKIAAANWTRGQQLATSTARMVFSVAMQVVGETIQTFTANPSRTRSGKFACSSA